MASKEKVRHLLSHTGGTGDIFGPEFEAHRLELRTLQDYVKLYSESGQSVIVLCNLDSPSASRLGDWLHARRPLK